MSREIREKRRAEAKGKRVSTWDQEVSEEYGRNYDRIFKRKGRKDGKSWMKNAK